MPKYNAISSNSATVVKSRLVYSSRRNPCRHCGDTSGKCRTGGELDMCFSLVDEQNQTRPGFDRDWVKIGSNNLWALMKFDPMGDGRGVKRIATRKTTTGLRTVQQKIYTDPALRHERYGAAMDILLPLTLESSRFKAEIKKRGLKLKDAIEFGYRELPARFDFETKIDVPGIPYSINVLNESGIFIPVVNKDGLIVNAEIRLYEAIGGRYRSLSSSQYELHIASLKGELVPSLAFLNRNILESHELNIILVEGRGFKVHYVARKNPQSLVVGANGGNWLVSLPHFWDAIGEKKIESLTIQTDGNDLSNNAVLNKYQELVLHLKKAIPHLKVSVSTSGLVSGFGKDIDENGEFTLLSAEEFLALELRVSGDGNTDITVISNVDFRLAKKAILDNPSKFGKVTKKDLKNLNGDELIGFSNNSRDELKRNFHELKQHARTLTVIDLQTSAITSLLSLISEDNWKFTPNFSINSKYIGYAEIENSRDLNLAKIVAIKSDKGTGKTEWLKTFLEGFLVLSITHRVQLGKAQSNRLGWGFQTDFSLNDVQGEKLSKAELRKANSYLSSKYSIEDLIVVVDSMHRDSVVNFNPSNFEGYTVVIDEFEQVLEHMLSSITCRENRATILNNFTQVLRGAGKIILLDADLSDLSVDYVAKLADTDSIFKLENTYKVPKEYKVFNTPNPALLIESAIESVKQGHNIFVVSDSIKPSSKYSTHNLRKLFSEFVADDNILEINSLTVADNKSPAYQCTEDINEIVPKYRVVLASPSINTGVSIDVKHFHAVFGVFNGVLGTRDILQGVNRVRDTSIPTYVWTKHYGISNNQWFDFRGVDIFHKLGKTYAKIAEFANFELNPDSKESYHVRQYCNIVARKNTDMFSLRENLMQYLSSQSSSIEVVNGTGLKETTEKIKTLQNESKEYEVKAIAEIPMAEDDIAALKKRFDNRGDGVKSIEENQQFVKYQLFKAINRVPNEIQIKEWLDIGYRPLLLNFCLFNPQYLKSIELERLAPLIQGACDWDVVNKSIAKTINPLLKCSSLINWLKTANSAESEVHNDSPILHAVVTEIEGLNIGSLKTVLKTLGYKLEYVGKKRLENNRFNVKRLVDLAPNLRAAFEEKLRSGPILNSEEDINILNFGPLDEKIQSHETSPLPLVDEPLDRIEGGDISVQGDSTVHFAGGGNRVQKTNRKNLPMDLVRGGEYEIFHPTQQKWFRAIFHSYVAMDFGGELAIVGLNFEANGELVRVSRHDDIRRPVSAVQ